jgi:hypothetical protein
MEVEIPPKRQKYLPIATVACPKTADSVSKHPNIRFALVKPGPV